MSDDAAVEPVPGTPLLRVVKGAPTPEELAALVAVVAARQAGGAPEPTKLRSRWGHPALSHRRAHRPGPGQWRASAW